MSLNIETYVLSKKYTDTQIVQNAQGEGVETDPVYTSEKANLMTKDQIAQKQDVLTAGKNIVIENNTISAIATDLPAESDPLYTQDKPNIALKSELPTNVSDLNNDSGYITAQEESDPTVPDHVKKITQQDIIKWNNKSDFSGEYKDLSNKPYVPTKISELNNDQGYITGYTETDPTISQLVKDITQDDINLWNSKSDFSGDYNDLLNKPDIPKTEDFVTQEKLNPILETKQDIMSAGNNISIVDNVINADIPKLDESDPVYLADKTNLVFKSEIPTQISQIRNDSGYITAEGETDPTVPDYVKSITVEDIALWDDKSTFNGDYDKLINKPSLPTKLSELNNDSNFATEDYVNEQLSSFGIMSVVPSLPSMGEPNKVYLVPKTNPDGSNSFDEYIWVNDTWELVDNKGMSVDLSNYYNKKDSEALLANKQNTLTAGENITIKDNVISATVQSSGAESDPIYMADKHNLARKSDIPTKLSDLENDIEIIQHMPLATNTNIGGLKTGNDFGIDGDGRIYNKYIELKEFNDSVAPSSHDYTQHTQGKKITNSLGSRCATSLHNNTIAVVAHEPDNLMIIDRQQNVIRRGIPLDRKGQTQHASITTLNNGNIAVTFRSPDGHRHLKIFTETGDFVKWVDLTADFNIALSVGDACAIAGLTYGGIVIVTNDDFTILDNDGNLVAQNIYIAPNTLYPKKWGVYALPTGNFAIAYILYRFPDDNEVHVRVYNANGKLQREFSPIGGGDVSVGTTDHFGDIAITVSPNGLMGFAVSNYVGEYSGRAVFTIFDEYGFIYTAKHMFGVPFKDTTLAYDRSVWICALPDNNFLVGNMDCYWICDANGGLIETDPIRSLPAQGFQLHASTAVSFTDGTIAYFSTGHNSYGGGNIALIGETQQVNTRNYVDKTVGAPAELKKLRAYVAPTNDGIVPVSNSLNLYPITTVLKPGEYYELVFHNNRYVATEIRSSRLTFDSEPTEGSNNLVCSGAIKKYIDDLVAQLKTK